jgi:hypothetical protein
MSKVEPQQKIQGGLSGGLDSPAKEMKSATPPAFSLSAGTPQGLKAGIPGGEGEGELIGGSGHALVGGGPDTPPTAPPAAAPTPAAPATPATPAAPAAAATTISSRTTTPARWGANGEFEWVVAFDTNATNGWIVQEVANTYNPQDATGKPLGPPHATPLYYEAWAVDASSVVTPNPTGSNDWWLRPNRGNNTKGDWSMTAKVYFTTTDPKTQGFTSGGVPDAGILLSSTTAPSGLGTVKLNRKADGKWDSSSTPAVPHKGSAA